MGQDRGEPLIVIVDGNSGNGLAPAVDKLLHARQILAGLPIGLTRLANDDALHLLTGHVGLQPFEQLRSRDSRQSSRNNLERIGDCQSGALPAVIDRKDSGQKRLFNVVEQPSVRIGSTQLIAALHSRHLIIEGRSHHAIHVAIHILHHLSGIAGILQTLLQTLGIGNH